MADCCRENEAILRVHFFFSCSFSFILLERDLAANVSERKLKKRRKLLHETVMHVVLQMSNLISVDNSKTVLTGASSSQR